jgi:type II secretion system protein N
MAVRLSGVASMARMTNLGPRGRKLVRYGGFALLGLITFVFAFQLSFPFGRVKDKVIEALSEKYEVTIGDVERGLIPGRMYFKAVSLRTRPTKASDVATTFYIEQLEVDVGLLALLRSTIAVKLDAKIGPGHIKGKIGLSKDGTSIDMVGEDLPSASLPVREALGLPMSGKLRFAFDLELPNDKAKSGKVAPNWAKAEGSAELACPSGCTIGDGKTKLKVNVKNQRQQAFAEGGIDFGKVNIDTLFVNVEIKRGKLDITKFEAKSPDGELHVDFDLTLNQDLNSSLVAGCLRFKGSEALLKREPKTHAALSTTGALLGPDNLFHIKLDGPLREMARRPLACGPAVNTAMDNPGGTPGTPARPNLTVAPEAPTQPPVGSGVAQPPPSPITPVTPQVYPIPEDAGADAHIAQPGEGAMPAAPPGVPAPEPNPGSASPGAPP